MKRILDYKINAQDAGQSILSYLKQKHYSRSVIIHLKKTPDGILVNNEWAYVNQVLKEDDILTIRLIEPLESCEDSENAKNCGYLENSENSENQKPSKIVPVKLPIAVVYEDADILAVNKPAGMPIHPSMDNYENTLANAAAYHAKERQEQYPYRCINRLDRDTSGLTIIAKNPYSSCILYEQMRCRQIQRTYYAIVEGMTKPHGIVDAPIARKSGTIIERTVDFASGGRAVTHFETLAYDAGKGLSFLKLRLETGRTHQIRVHMRYIGHPLIGDFLYNAKDSRMHRQALHAGNLDFFHPVSGQPLHFAAPLPKDMLQFFFVVIP